MYFSRNVFEIELWKKLDKFGERLNLRKIDTVVQRDFWGGTHPAKIAKL